MRVSIAEDTVDDDAARALELARLRDFLAGEPELRGRVAGVERPPADGTLGPILDLLMVALEPEGTVAVLAAGLVTWLQRRGNVTIRIERPDGRVVELQADRAKSDPESVKELIRALEETPRPDGPAEPGNTAQR